MPWTILCRQITYINSPPPGNSDSGKLFALQHGYRVCTVLWTAVEPGSLLSIRSNFGNLYLLYVWPYPLTLSMIPRYWSVCMADSCNRPMVEIIGYLPASPPHRQPSWLYPSHLIFPTMALHLLPHSKMVSYVPLIAAGNGMRGILG